MHPVLFKIGFIEIRPYGLMYLLAMVLSFCFLNTEIRRKNITLSQNELFNLILISVFSGIIGARVYFVLFKWEYFSQHLVQILAIRNGGLASHGGFVAGTAAGYLYLKHQNEDFLKFADSAVPLIVLGEACVRFGNFINGEAHGLPTTLPWGIVFPPGTLAGNQFPKMAIHPTMLYQLFYNLLVFLVIWGLFRKHSYRDGFVAALTTIFYSMGRYVIEGLRADSLYLGHYRIAQLMCLALISMMLVCIYCGKLWIKSPSNFESGTKHTATRKVCP